MLRHEERRALRQLWRALDEKIGGNFITVLNYHVEKRVGRPAQRLFLEDPPMFKQVFIAIFGRAAWKLFLRIMIEECAQRGINSQMITRHFR